MNYTHPRVEKLKEGDYRDLAQMLTNYRDPAQMFTNSGTENENLESLKNKLYRLLNDPNCTPIEINGIKGYNINMLVADIYYEREADNDLMEKVLLHRVALDREYAESLTKELSENPNDISEG